MSGNGYYTVATLVPCEITARDHTKSTRVTRRGYRNNTLEVTCACGAKFRALTYAHKGRPAS